MTLRIRFLFPLLLLGLLFAVGCKSTRVAQKGSGVSGRESGKLASEDPLLRQQISAQFIDAATKEAQEYYDDALEGYEAIVKLDPANHAAHYLIAKAYHRKGEHTTALPHAHKAVDIHPNNVFYQLQHARLLMYAGKQEPALSALQKARLLFPDDVELISELGDLFLRAKQYDKALGLYDTLLMRKGMDAEILRQKREVYTFLNRKEDALQTQLRLVNEYPAITEFRHELYDMYLSVDSLDAAERLLEELLHEEPNDAFALFRLIESYQRTGVSHKADSLADIVFALPNVELDEKIQLLMRLDKDPEDTLQQERVTRLVRRLQTAHSDSPILAAYMSERYLREDKPDSARVWLKKAALLDEANLQLWLRLIHTNLEMDLMDSLMVDGQLAIDIFPNNADILFAYAHAAYMLKKYDSAAEALERVRKMTMGIRAAEAHMMLGDAYHYLGDFVKSDKNYEESLKLNPNSHTAMNNYAYFLAVRNERLGYASELIEKAMKAQPLNPYFMDTYGWILFRKGELDEALRWMLKSYELAPSAEVANHLGDVYLKKENPEKALHYWTIAAEDADLAEEVQKKIKALQP